MSSLIDRFLTDTYTVTRSTSGQYSGGFYVPGPTQTVQIQGSMQPLNARDLLQVEEGYRLKQLWKFYTDQPLTVMTVKTLGSSDRVQINGESYRVLSSESWQGIGVDLPYHKSIVAREPENNS